MLASIAACSGSPGASKAPESSSAPSAPPAEGSAAPAPEKTDAPSGGPDYGGTLSIICPDTAQPFGLPWQMAMMEQTSMVPFGETLILETVGGDLLPWLATSWNIDVENLEIVFQLREGVKFSDGSDFNAEVVYWQFMNAIESKCMNSAVADFEVRGEFEIAAILSSYVNSTITHFSSHVACIVSKENYDKNGEDYAREHPVGTGPFIMTDWVPGMHIKYEKNENYWQEGKPYLDEVVLVAMTDTMTQVAAMLSTGSDAIDVMRTSIGEQVATISADPNIKTTTVPSGSLFLTPSSLDEDSPLAKREVRQAIFHAVDREAICDARGFGVLKPSYQIFNPPYKGAIDAYNYGVFEDPYDPEKARALLAEAGYPDGFSTVFHAPAAIDRDAAVAIQSMLADVGIDVELQYPEAGAATDLRMNGWDGILATSIGSMTNTTSTLRLTLDPFYDYLPSVWRSVDNYEELFVASRETPVLEAERVAAIVQLMMDEMVAIPVYQTATTCLMKNHVQDSGFGDYGPTTTIWLPWDAWISK